MAPWIQIAKPFSYHFAFNCIKTIIGAAFIGHGVALLTTTTRTKNRVEDNDDDNPDHDEEKSSRKKEEEGGGGTTNNKKKNRNRNTNNNRSKKYNSTVVAATTTIGFGLFLSLPSLMSQIVWETLIPVITATDLVYDISTENAGKMISTATATKLFPKFPNFPKLQLLQSPPKV